MTEYETSEQLRLLMVLSIEPVAVKLRLLPPSA
jgi:hypothetical protein